MINNLKVLFVLTIVLGLFSYYIIYYKEAFCDFSSCENVITNIAPSTTETPNQPPAQKGLKELDGGR